MIKLRKRISAIIKRSADVPWLRLMKTGVKKDKLVSILSIIFKLFELCL